MREADKCGVKFLCSVFTQDAVKRARRWGYPAVKIASSEIGNEALLRLVAELCPGRPIWLSTGEAGLTWWDTIEQALEWLAPVRKNVTLMHCVAAYPTAAEDAYLARMALMREQFGLDIGWSSHVTAPDAAQVAAEAVRLGATVVEVHLRVEGVSPENAPDWGEWALFPSEFAEFAAAVREAEG
jgi:sialic acid synthase SpsE